MEVFVQAFQNLAPAAGEQSAPSLCPIPVGEGGT